MKNPIRPSFKTETIPIIFIILALVSSFYFYANFPERVPTHWNAHGEIDGWSGKTFGAFFFPALNICVYLLMLFLPLADPKKKNYSDFKHIYHIVKGALVIFLAAIYIATSLNALGRNIPINVFVPVGIGILFIIIGYYLKEVKPNWFFGIRTPWTLSSDRVWRKTHQLGSKVFILAGVLMILASIWPQLFIYFILILIAMIFGVIGYSYYIYKH